MKAKYDIDQIEDLLNQLAILNKDYDELVAMKSDTQLVEKEIRSRIVILKIKARYMVENLFDIPVILDGALLTYEKAVKKKAYVNRDEVDGNNIDLQYDGHNDYYYYMEKDIYHLDIYEESLLIVVKFINFKKEYPLQQLSSLITAIRKIEATSYGYRLSLISTRKDKQDIENIYTGTIFNNSRYSLRCFNLIDKLLLKIKDDYITRINSSYSTLDYMIQAVNNYMLIINIKTGVTDILNEEEASICHVAFEVKKCFTDEDVLINSSSADVKIERLQAVVYDYIAKRKNVT